MFTYSENQIAPQTDKPRQRALPKLIADMKAAVSAEDRELLIRQMLRSIGFEWLAYGTVNYAPPAVRPLTFFSSYANPAWARHYFDEHYYDVDPRHAYAPNSGLPLIWDVDDVASWVSTHQPTLHGRRFVQDFRESGMRSGIFFNLTTPAQSTERTVISLSSSLSNRRWITDSVVGQALTLGLCLHEFLAIHARVLPGGERKGELSQLQKDILACLVKGYSNKEIARSLDLTLHNVDYHLRQLRSRFSAHNRVQLVNAAMAPHDEPGAGNKPQFLAEADLDYALT